MAQASEAATAKSRRKTEAPEPGSGANGFDTVFPFSFSHFHTGNAATVTQANEILVQAARSIWDSQAELFRLDVDSARNAFESFKVGVPPQQALSQALEQWHRRSETALTHMRAIGDALRECEWQLMGLAAKGNAPQDKADE